MKILLSQLLLNRAYYKQLKLFDMKKMAIAFIVAISLGMLIPVNAQMHGNMTKDSTHWEGMHKKMMSNHGNIGDMKENGMRERKPWMMHDGRGNKMSVERQLMHYAILVKRLPGMQNELGLTDDQVSKLVDLQTAFIKQKADLKADLTKKELKLKNSLKNNASSKEISEQLTSCAASRISIGVAAYETANNMKSVLNDSQKQKLNERFEKLHSSAHSCEMNK